MSPFIDVTNTITQEVDIHNESCEIISCSKSKNEKNNLDNHSSLNCLEYQKEIKDDQIYSVRSKTSVNVNKISLVSTKCRCSGAKPKVANKNNKGRSKRTSSENLGEASSTFAQQNKNDRVPPIEYDHFFHSLERLSLNTDKERKSVLEENCKNQCKSESKVCCNGSADQKETQSKNFLSTYQCIACGLELSSLEILTNHLVKHIYEGLHAASWLNHAMSVLLVDNNPASNFLHIQNLQTQTTRREEASQVDVKNSGNENSTINPNSET